MAATQPLAHQGHRCDGCHNRFHQLDFQGNGRPAGQGEQGMANEKKTAPLDAAMAEKLLDRLTTDDDFRARFQTDPKAALESLGHIPGDDEGTATGLAAPFSACSVSKLASKEDLLSARRELMGTLTQGLAYNTPTFESETFERRTRK